MDTSATAQSVIPYLAVRGAAEAIAFYTQIFGAEEVMRFEHHDRVGHAELRFGSTPLMLADECPEMGASAPAVGSSVPVSLMLYVDDVDSVVAKAIAAGATEVHPVADQFWGDRSGRLTDPFGYRWDVATHKEDVPRDELMRRAQKMFGA